MAPGLSTPRLAVDGNRGAPRRREWERPAAIPQFDEALLAQGGPSGGGRPIVKTAVAQPHVGAALVQAGVGHADEGRRLLRLTVDGGQSREPAERPRARPALVNARPEPERFLVGRERAPNVAAVRRQPS